jgi:hypothetical protein
MREDILKTVQVLREKIHLKEAEVAGLKSIINGLYKEENEVPPYSDASTRAGAGIEGLRSDQFYGQTLAGATRQYLEMRKASGQGSASVSDIFYALKKGGYKFDASTDEYAKNGVRMALRKNSVTFHRLPNGDYGLLDWYERPKSGNGEDSVKPNAKKHKRGKKRAKSGSNESVGTEKAETAPPRPEPLQQNGAPLSRSGRILSVLRSNPNKDWDHHDIQKQLPDLDEKAIRSLLYSLKNNKKAAKTGPGKFKAIPM